MLVLHNTKLNTISVVARQLFSAFANRAYRRAFAADVGIGLATQIRLLREQRFGRQQDLADHLGKRQETISQWENPDYGRYSLSTLRALADAFDVPLIVRFGTWSELAAWHAHLGPESLVPLPYEDEARQLGNVNEQFSVANADFPLTLNDAVALRGWLEGHIANLEDAFRRRVGAAGGEASAPSASEPPPPS